MLSNSKNHTISKIVAKSALRISLILFGVAIIALAIGDKNKANLPQIQFVYQNKISLIAPITLFFIYLVLLILTLKHKYQKIEINWMFSLTAFFIIAYLILLYARIYPYLMK